MRRGARTVGAAIAALDHALGRLMRPLADLLPRRLRRAAEKIEREQTRPIGELAAAGFLITAILYGLVAGGQIGRLGDSLLVLAGFGIETVDIAGEAETAELAILERLELGGSLVWFDVQTAQERIAALPWVETAAVRKFYPSTLSVEIAERKPFALWQREGEVFVVDRGGTKIVPLEESRFSQLPFVVGAGANELAGEIVATLAAEPAIVDRVRAAVRVAGRRWDLYLDNGVTVKLPEKDLRAALAHLVKLDAERQLLARDVVVVDLRLPDRVTVRLPEGRTLEEVISGESDSEART
jgi:cell division protein FtsQ